MFNFTVPSKLQNLKTGRTTFASRDYPEYSGRYPKGLNLKPGSEVHTRVRNFILQNAMVSHEEISKRFPAWRKINHKLTTFIDLSKAEKEIKDQDSRKPVSIVIPQSYATKDAIMTYWVASVLQSPLFRYDPSEDSNDTVRAMVLEALVNRQMARKKGALAMYRMGADDTTYGFGACLTGWAVEHGKRSRAGGPAEEVLFYEGNTVIPLDPFRCLPDPSRPVEDVENMTFFGYLDTMNYMGLLGQERNDKDMFNVKYLKHMETGSSYFQVHASRTGRVDKTAMHNLKQGVNYSSPFDVLWMFVKLVPADLGLGESEYPEIWKFGLAADQVIVYAKQAPFDHGRIPVNVIATESDSHTSLPVSSLEIEYPIQEAIDWLWSSHITNKRKAINNMFLVDPSVINLNDLVDTRYGMLAKVRAAHFGRVDMKNHFMQVPVTDVTQGHVNDMSLLMGIGQQISGVNSQMRGQQERKGSRVSATEARGTQSSALSRLETKVWIASEQGYKDLSRQLASNTIQFQKNETVVKMTGDYERMLKETYGLQSGFLSVNPAEAFDFNYDIVIPDRTVPTGDFGDVWVRLVTSMQTMPEVRQEMDFVKIFKHIARSFGARNVESFMRNKNVQPQVVPDEEAFNRAADGELTNVGDALGEGLL